MTSIEGAASYLTTMIATEGDRSPGGAGGAEDHFLSGRAPYYRTYATPVGEIATAAVEAKFWVSILDALDLNAWADIDADKWTECSGRVADRLATMSEKQLEELLDLPCVNRMAGLIEAGLHLSEPDEFGVIRPRPPLSLTPYPQVR